MPGQLGLPFCLVPVPSLVKGLLPALEGLVPQLPNECLLKSNFYSEVTPIMFNGASTRENVDRIAAEVA